MRKSRAGITLRFVHLCAVAAAAAFFIEIIPANNGISLISSFVCSVFFFLSTVDEIPGEQKKNQNYKNLHTKNDVISFLILFLVRGIN
jgi:hypothetical protein